MLRWRPGRVGRLLRWLAYLPVVRQRGPLLVAEYVHIWQPWRLRIGGHVRLGRYNQSNCTGGVHIGDGVIIGPFVLISSTNHKYDDVDTPIHHQGLVPEATVIEDDVWIGGQAVITAGATVGTEATIAAGAVVTRDVPSNTVVGRVPAVPIKERGASVREGVE